MTKYLNQYMDYITKKLEDDEDTNELLEEHLIKIKFMQHERLIHFLVTMLFSLLFMISLGIHLITDNIGVFVLNILLLILLIHYIKHYYFLENTVQKMYKIYDLIKDKKF